MIFTISRHLTHSTFNVIFLKSLEVFSPPVLRLHTSYIVCVCARYIVYIYIFIQSVYIYIIHLVSRSFLARSSYPSHVVCLFPFLNFFIFLTFLASVSPHFPCHSKDRANEYMSLLGGKLIRCTAWSKNCFCFARDMKSLEDSDMSSVAMTPSIC